MFQFGLPVPKGVVVSTSAFSDIVQGLPELQKLIRELPTVNNVSLDELEPQCAEVRAVLETRPIPDALHDDIHVTLESFIPKYDTKRFAVRSSASAEDLPTASFAGQMDTYLNVQGLENISAMVMRCFASAFTTRAVLYRIEQGFDHTQVDVAVVVQLLVPSEFSGVLFTADPTTGHRGRVVIDAAPGLGEAVVSGQVNPARYRCLPDGTIIDFAEGTFDDAVVANEGSDGTHTVKLESGRMPDAVVKELVTHAKRSEELFGLPQDIEYGVSEGRVFILQSRAITTLDPRVECQDEQLRVFISFNHAQQMLDPMCPLSYSVWGCLLPFGKDVDEGIVPSKLVTRAGPFMYIDVTPILKSKARNKFTNVMSIALAGMGQAVADYIAGDEFTNGNKQVKPLTAKRFSKFYLPIMRRALPFVVGLKKSDTIVDDLDAVILNFDKTHPDPVIPDGDLQAARDALYDVFRSLKKMWSFSCQGEVGSTFPHFIASGFPAQLMVKKLAHDKTLAQTVFSANPGNITSRMDLMISDISDSIKVHDEGFIFDYTHAQIETALESGELCDETVGLIKRFLQIYYMRGPSEIDIAQKRFSEDLAILMSFAKQYAGHAVGHARAHFKELTVAADAAAEELIAHCSPLKRPLMRRMIRVGRHCFAARDHPKVFIMAASMQIKRIALRVGMVLEQAGYLSQADDALFLTAEETVAYLDALLAGPDPSAQAKYQAIADANRAEYVRLANHTPPAVVTSTGEALRLPPKPAPPGAHGGTGVSRGVVTAPCAVLSRPTDPFPAGSILVTRSTDPAWTSLFSSAKGVVLEVGGLMTHGSVVAREFGIPGVILSQSGPVAQIFKSGDILTVDGDNGFVRIESESEAEADVNNQV
ncbi:Pyruvate phosphate dikinase PEP/pyruvate binding domain [Carpediemonas membranifera]|uniref:Pyruvate phosphate dikinase PEP/pyruvate binding domain n=1 Tax=Carpediemonas membranifera TaxID=201153 RepID=A0A8J6BAA3_9EUKA|nr:Pyruvate phosphate dikinase PEP/pyruvate binding domain [Carpediemonas membranifera]|eukprot:KAG9393222.1 Pyruvate phosphate dikinase PEP/pyruvate binding domain [Carpediemonas membranifera]